MTTYAVFGRGRVGLNLAAYLKSLGHEVQLISRRDVEARWDICVERVKDADIIAAAIPDDKLAGWYEAWRGEFKDTQIIIHFSGAASVDGIHAVHPLYSFPQSLLPMDRLQDIIFARVSSAPPFEEIFPGARNPHFTIEEKDRTRYHALAVLAGNLPAYIWNTTAMELSSLTGMTADKVMGTYLNSIIDRFGESPVDSLTGPVARRDRATVMRNLQGLEGSSELASFYKAFVAAAWPDFKAPEK